MQQTLGTPAAATTDTSFSSGAEPGDPDASVAEVRRNGGFARALTPAATRVLEWHRQRIDSARLAGAAITPQRSHRS